jgi:hypothetical protein
MNVLLGSLPVESDFPLSTGHEEDTGWNTPRKRP